MSIFDRCRIDPFQMPSVENAQVYSTDIASVAVRISAAAYALTSDLSELYEDFDNRRDIPFGALRALSGSGEGRSERDWFEPDGEVQSFNVTVVGGAAYGVLLNDLIFVGFRGTSVIDDWAINLFGGGRRGILRVQLESRYYLKNFCEFISLQRPADAYVHGGFYRVAQALSESVEQELQKLQAVYRRHRPGSAASVILTGHSLGGALALLAGLHLDHEAVYTFGMPRVAEQGVLTELPACHYRHILKGDPVPNLPPDFCGFRHDMPSVELDPYRGLPKPNRLSKLVRGWLSGQAISGSIMAAVKAVIAAEHDMGLYVDTVMNQSRARVG